MLFLMQLIQFVHLHQFLIYLVNDEQYIYFLMMMQQQIIFVYFLLTRVSGIPLLESAAERRWGDCDEYILYKKRTGRLLPKLF